MKLYDLDLFLSIYTVKSVWISKIEVINDSRVQFSKIRPVVNKSKIQKRNRITNCLYFSILLNRDCIHALIQNYTWNLFFTHFPIAQFFDSHLLSATRHFSPTFFPNKLTYYPPCRTSFPLFPSDSTRAGIPPSAKMRINGAPIAGGGGGGGLIASD